MLPLHESSLQRAAQQAAVEVRKINAQLEAATVLEKKQLQEKPLSPHGLRYQCIQIHVFCPRRIT